MSDVKGRDIKIDQFTLSFHGRLLIEGAEIALNYGQRYGLLGENGSGKVSNPVVELSFLCKNICVWNLVMVSEIALIDLSR